MDLPSWNLSEKTLWHTACDRVVCRDVAYHDKARLLVCDDVDVLGRDHARTLVAICLDGGEAILPSEVLHCCNDLLDHSLVRWHLHPRNLAPRNIACRDLGPQ